MPVAVLDRWSPGLPVVWSVGGGLVLLWLLLLVVLWVGKPDEVRLREALRLLPDVVCLLQRLARDRTLPHGCGCGWCCCWPTWRCQ